MLSVVKQNQELLGIGDSYQIIEKLLGCNPCILENQLIYRGEFDDEDIPRGLGWYQNESGCIWIMDFEIAALRQEGTGLIILDPRGCICFGSDYFNFP